METLYRGRSVKTACAMLIPSSAPAIRLPAHAGGSAKPPAKRPACGGIWTIPSRSERWNGTRASSTGWSLCRGRTTLSGARPPQGRTALSRTGCAWPSSARGLQDLPVPTTWRAWAMPAPCLNRRRSPAAEWPPFPISEARGTLRNWRSRASPRSGWRSVLVRTSESGPARETCSNKGSARYAWPWECTGCRMLRLAIGALVRTC